MDITIGRCGLACEVCSRFNKACRGCMKENRSILTCIIYNCAEKKNIKYCVQCPENPCSLMRGLSKAYCPVGSQIRLNC